MNIADNFGFSSTATYNERFGTMLTNTDLTYDANGNTLVQNDVVSGKNKSMHWDEDNMMRGIVVNDNKIQHYLYDAAGERTAKAQGTVTVVSVNGSIVTEEVSMGNYTLYPSGYLVVSPSGQYTKHYYNGSERIASKIAGAVSSIGGSALSGSQSGTLVARQTADLTNIITTEGFENLVWANPTIVTNPCTGLTGEALKQCLCANGTCTDVIYFFHPDHLGSSTFLTDFNGQGYEFMLYLPFGEALAQQKAAGYSTPYKFTSKERDEHTGLDYFGARYYDPSLGVFHGVDPLAYKFPHLTPFNYAENNPISNIDYWGLQAVPSQFLYLLKDKVDQIASSVTKTSTVQKANRAIETVRKGLDNAVNSSKNFIKNNGQDIKQAAKDGEIVTNAIKNTMLVASINSGGTLAEVTLPVAATAGGIEFCCQIVQFGVDWALDDTEGIREGQKNTTGEIFEFVVGKVSDKMVPGISTATRGGLDLITENTSSMFAEPMVGMLYNDNKKSTLGKSIPTIKNNKDYSPKKILYDFQVTSQ